MDNAGHVKKPMRVVMPQKGSGWVDTRYFSHNRPRFSDHWNENDNTAEPWGWQESKKRYAKKTLPLIITFIILYLPLL